MVLGAIQKTLRTFNKNASEDEIRLDKLREFLELVYLNKKEREQMYKVIESHFVTSKEALCTAPLLQLPDMI